MSLLGHLGGTFGSALDSWFQLTLGYHALQRALCSPLSLFEILPLPLYLSTLSPTFSNK